MVSIDEKSQIQALDRTQLELQHALDCPPRQTHGYVRHGTTTLFAALEVTTGKISADVCYPHAKQQRRVPSLSQTHRQGPPARETAG